MVKNLFRNLRDNFVYLFIPMGILYLFLLAALFFFFLAFAKSAGVMLGDLATLIHLSTEQSSASVNEFLSYSFGQLNWDGSLLEILRQILDTEWLEQTLVGFFATLNASTEGFEEEFTAIVTTFAGEVKAGLSLFAVLFALGVLAASYATRYAVRRRSAKRSLHKFLLAHTVVPFVQWALLLLSFALLFFISYYTLLVTAAAIVISSAISLLCSWVIYGGGKVKLQQVINFRNILSHLAAMGILIVLNVAVFAALYYLQPLFAFLLILPIVLFSLAVADVNTDAYVLSLQPKQETACFLKTLPVAHRGLHDETKPENSLAAFKAAIEAGYAIETDVHFTKDGQIAVFHDDSLERMTGDKRELKDLTLAELKQLRLGGTEERIPSFEEFLEFVGGKVPLLIEIKEMKGVKGKEISSAMLAVMKKMNYRGEYAVQSFDPFYVKAYKKLAPEVPCGILAQAKMSEKKDKLSWKFKAYLLSRMKFNGLVEPDFISYGFWKLPQRCVTKFGGIKLAWTVRSPEDEKQARKYVDNIIFENFLAEK